MVSSVGRNFCIACAISLVWESQYDMFEDEKNWPFFLFFVVFFFVLFRVLGKRGKQRRRVKKEGVQRYSPTTITSILVTGTQSQIVGLTFLYFM